MHALSVKQKFLFPDARGWSFSHQTDSAERLCPLQPERSRSMDRSWMPDALEGEWSLSKVENITGWSSYAYIESDPKLTLNEKRLLNMVTSFCLNGSKGALTLKNYEIGVLLNLAPKSVGNLVSSLEGKKRIVIENRQSPYRRLLLPSDSGTDSVTLPRTSGSEEYPLPSNSGSTSIPQCLTSTPEWNHFHSPVEHNKRIELNKKIKGLFSSEYILFRPKSYVKLDYNNKIDLA